MRTRNRLGLTVSGLALTVGGVLTVGLAGQLGPAAAAVGEHKKSAAKHRSHAHHDDCRDGAGKDQNLDWNADWGRDWGNDGDNRWNRNWGDGGNGGNGDWSRDFDSDNTKPKCAGVVNQAPRHR
ncbi:hypothetical protein ACRYCC_38895 [Actinomadura scrupuli]|uniref:hypothetical protein n=1 Tax=Actinomadura scrupuli TaxID=559629 RepID=UPI003D97BC46